MTDPRDTRRCEQCGEEYTRPSTTSRSAFAKRRFCSAKCNGASMRKDRPVRFCGWCGTPFTPMNPTVDTCSRECANKWTGSKRRIPTVTRVGRHVVERVVDPQSRQVSILVDSVEVVRTTDSNYNTLRRAVIRTIERLEQAA